MIGYLKGEIISKKEDFVILSVNNIGYKIEITGFTRDTLSEVSNEIEFWIHSHVREQEFRLFGFLDSRELDLFELLITVSGVGPKSALAIMNIGYEKIVHGVITGNIIKEKISGVGKKTLEKLVVDLKTKVSGLPTTNNIASISKMSTFDDDLVEALLGLGYKKIEIDDTLKNISDDLENKNLSQQIKLALGYLR